jgi:hypothetical protein
MVVICITVRWSGLGVLPDFPAKLYDRGGGMDYGGTNPGSSAQGR